jgi:hypothetical protein
MLAIFGLIGAVNISFSVSSQGRKTNILRAG